MVLKGKVVVEAGYIACPYIPEIEVPMTWQEHLDYYSVRLFEGVVLPEMKLDPTKTILDIALSIFQNKWPGNYHIEEFFNAKKGRWDLRLRFADPREETMWLLRWS